MSDLRWFAGLETIAEMNSLAIGAIEEIMGDSGIPASSKVAWIALWIKELNEKKDSVGAESGVEENIQSDYIVNEGVVANG